MTDEHKQIAALTCMDIDILARVAESEQWDAKDLREFIFRLKKQKDLLVTDANVRETRYNAASNIHNIANNKGAL